VSDQHPLLLAAGRIPDPGIGEPVGVDGVQHLPHRLTAAAGWQPGSRRTFSGT
jgi:hypothetical protein